MFEYDEEDNRYVAAHHPFTSPKDEHLEYLETDPGRCLAKAYDMVLNGWEIGGGSVRIYQEDVQSKVFRALKIGEEEARAKFGFLLDALQYGAPPHGGIAFGLDRIVTMMAGADSIRDVIAFPKTQRAQCLLTQAPSEVDERQLRELHIRLRQPEAETAMKSEVITAEDKRRRVRLFHFLRYSRSSAMIKPMYAPSPYAMPSRRKSPNPFSSSSIRPSSTCCSSNAPITRASGNR